jgi:hypothetical protein
VDRQPQVGLPALVLLMQCCRGVGSSLPCITSATLLSHFDVPLCTWAASSILPIHLRSLSTF